jgi:two-component system, chemotaxis family, chemotaxis protein CheY
VACILIIDDDNFFRSVFRRILVSGGHEVVDAEGGAEGIEAYEKHRPALTIVDIFMPDMDGSEVIRQLKSRDPDARIIAISGRNLFHDNDGYIDQVRKQGAAAILRKLDSREMVLAEIGRVLNKPNG